MGTEIAIDLAARVTGATTDLASRVTGAIRDAARTTGAGFDYLLNTAIRESNLNPDAKAKSSSATGLFQFIDQTWLATMKQSGGKLGYGQYADAITKTASGRYEVADPAMRQKVFALRKDPTANALMAGAFANSNAKVLTERLGRKPSDGELYIAHFLGAAGATRLIKAAEAQPNGSAAALFPRAAEANNAIFFDKQGGARSFAQVYSKLVSRHDAIGAVQLASAQPTNAMAAIQQATRTAPSAGATLPSIAPVPGAAHALTSDPVIANAAARAAPPQQPMFTSLFQTEQRGAVSSVVRELWSTPRSAPAETTAAIDPAATTTGVSAPRGENRFDVFNLFRTPGQT